LDYFRARRFLDTLPDWERGRPPEGPLEHYLPRVQAMLRRCGNPQERFSSVIVAGTNGKGTTSSLLAELLRAGGSRVGLYTSPHLHTQRERIQVDGALLDKDTWAAALTAFADATHGFEREELGAFSRFEVLTVLAAQMFADAGVDLAVFEVGLGGRYDATNAWGHDVAVLTQVGLDHCAVLGHDVVTIAEDKLQVTRPGRPLFTTASQEPAVLQRVRSHCLQTGVPLHVCDAEGVLDIGEAAGSSKEERRRYLASAPTARSSTVSRPRTWADNARLSLAVAAHLRPDLAPATVRGVLDSHQWPGRFEPAGPAADHDQGGAGGGSRRSPRVILDGGHNPSSAAALRDDLAPLGDSWTFVVGVNHDHEAAQILKYLAPAAARFVLTSSEHPKAMTPADLATRAPAEVPVNVEPGWRDALERALYEAGDAGRICVTGSLHLVARAREFFGLPHEADGISEDVSHESLEVVQTACERLGWKAEEVSGDGNVVRVTGGRRPLLFYRNKHPFNDYVAARMAEDKGYQYEMLVAGGLPLPFTMQVFNPYAEERFNRYKTHLTVEEITADVDATMSYPVVVKKTRGSVSSGVFVEADRQGLRQRLQELFENSGFLDNLLLVQTFADGPEYRAVASQGELLLAYQKVSDGLSAHDRNPLHHPTGRAERVLDTAILDELARLTAKIAAVIDLGFYAVDLIRDRERGWQILELNPNPFCYFYNRTNGRDDFTAIYADLLRKYAT
jgi:dihydrofolate synthase/folylpolyglutamate synthase